MLSHVHQFSPWLRSRFKFTLVTTIQVGCILNSKLRARSRSYKISNTAWRHFILQWWDKVSPQKYCFFKWIYSTVNYGWINGRSVGKNNFFASARGPKCYQIQSCGWGEENMYVVATWTSLPQSSIWTRLRCRRMPPESCLKDYNVTSPLLSYIKLSV